MTDADILSNIRAGGPTHKRAPEKSASRSGVSAQDARMPAVAQQNLAELHRERTALAQKREAERSAAKAARLARIAERRGDDSVIDLVTDEGGDRRAKALAALENAERIRKTATITPKASSRSAAIRRPLLGSNDIAPRGRRRGSKT